MTRHRLPAVGPNVDGYLHALEEVAEMSTRAELVASVVHQMQFYQLSMDEALRRVTVRDLNYWRYWHRLTAEGQAALEVEQIVRDCLVCERLLVNVRVQL